MDFYLVSNLTGSEYEHTVSDIRRTEVCQGLKRRASPKSILQPASNTIHCSCKTPAGNINEPILKMGGRLRYSGEEPLGISFVYNNW